jgi:hypothetical protein
MAEPIVFDARDGLQAEVLQQLMSADRVTVGLKDERTAVLGYWIRTAENDALEQLGVIVLPWTLGPEQPTARRKPIEPPWARVDIQQARDNPHWQRILSMLRPGDRLTVGSENLFGHHQLKLWLADRLLATFPLRSFAAR